MGCGNERVNHVTFSDQHDNYCIYKWGTCYVGKVIVS